MVTFMVLIQAPLSQVKRELCELVERVEKGDSVVILRHGRAVARLVPMPARGKPWRVEKGDDVKLYGGVNLDSPVLEEI